MRKSFVVLLVLALLVQSASLAQRQAALKAAGAWLRLPSRTQALKSALSSWNVPAMWLLSR
jgi:hypothetical protein